jgi:hypothetical protein
MRRSVASDMLGHGTNSRRGANPKSPRTKQMSRISAVVLMAQSAASRPRALKTRPIRGVLWRSIECVPTASNKRFEPSAEVHWCRIWRHPDVPGLVRGPSRSADGQNRRLIVSNRRGAPHRARSFARSNEFLLDLSLNPLQ